MSSEEKKFAKGGRLEPSKDAPKYKIVLDRGEWVMNKKTIQDRIQKFYG